MTTKIISTTITTGYTLSSTYSELDITATGGIGGRGLTVTTAQTVHNFGVIHSNTSHSYNGVNIVNSGMSATGPFVNELSAQIIGYNGVVGGGLGGSESVWKGHDTGVRCPTGCDSGCGCGQSRPAPRTIKIVMYRERFPLALANDNCHGIAPLKKEAETRHRWRAGC